MTVLVEDAFKTLVDQFKDPFAFIRELVQNSLDAGSNMIDVAVRADGLLVTVEVQDTGDGMDREIIETKLVKLFASSKDGDATKIGKFGIGFASVFSIRPEAVVVDTARGGERWRLVFKADGSWKLFPLDEALEGTRVRVVKRVASQQDAQKMSADAKRTLLKWCRYADADIRFDGRPVREEFTLQSPLVVKVPMDAPGDICVVGLATVLPEWGFYNKGLTLLEGTGSFVDVPPWVSFRVRDGALEHTITRDNVIRDDAFHRVMKRINDAARGALIDAALDALEADHPQRDALCEALAAPLSQGAITGARLKKKVLRDGRGAGVSLHDLRQAKKKKRLARVEAYGALAAALENDGLLVVRASRSNGDGRLLEALMGDIPFAHDDHVAIEPASEKQQWAAAPLIGAMKKVLAAGESPFGEIIVARIEDATGALELIPAVVAHEVKKPIRRAGALAVLAPKRKKAKPTLVLNLAAEAVNGAIALASTDVWLAAFLALRLATPQSTLIGADHALEAMRQRCTT